MTGTDDSGATRERQVLELVEAALELTPEARAPWIEERCAGDAGLLERVTRLLESAANEESAASRTDDVHEAVTRVLAEGSILRRGERLGVYEIGEELGRGGMGVVYSARRVDETFDLRVAIKTIGVLGRPDLAERFDRERRILARLRHPSIANVLDGGTTTAGVPYLVMEFVEGEPLDTYCDRRRLSTVERLELFLQVCDGVDHAHRNLVVHRDLKPANILVTEEGEVKLLDFGVAKLLDEEGRSRTSTATLWGGHALTPEYASPEQIRLEPATTSSDVYALGVLLYELLTGSRPYELPDRTPQSLLRIVCETEAPAPSRMAQRTASVPTAEARKTTPAKLARQLRGDLDNIVLAALHKEPKQRYGSVAALAEDIRGYLRGVPVRARPLTLSYLAGRFVKRHRYAVLAVAVVVLALVAGGAATVWQSVRASREAARVQKMNEFLESLLTTPDPIRGISPDATLVDLAEYATERLDRDFAQEAGIRGSLRRTLASTYLNLGMVERAGSELALAIEEHREAYGDLHPETLRSERYMAVYEESSGDASSALERLEGVIRALEAGAGTKEELGLAYEIRGSALSTLGEIEPALADYRRAIEILDALDGAGYEVVQAFNNMAVASMNTGDFATAEQALEEGLARSRLVEQGPYPLQARMTANLGLVYRETGRLEEARETLAEAVALLSELLGDDHPETLLSRIGLAEQQLALGIELESASAEMAAVLATAIDSLPPEHFVIPYAQVVRAKLLVATGDGAAAEAHIRAAIRARRQSLPEGHWLIASAEATLGESLLQQGRTEEAEAVLVPVYRILVEQRGADFTKAVEVKALLDRLGVADGEAHEPTG